MAIARVFIDVGAHTGETLVEVTRPRWRFDRIYCFEPSPAALEQLRNYASDQVIICPYGLSDHSGTAVLFGEGGLGASTFADSGTLEMGSPRNATVELVRASEWLDARLDHSDQIFVKLNCEGGELAILEDLALSGWLNQLHSVMIDFDSRKIPSLHSRYRACRAIVSSYANERFVESPEVMLGRTHQHRIANWLHYVGDDMGPIPLARRVRFLWWPSVTLPTIRWASRTKSQLRHYKR